MCTTKYLTKQKLNITDKTNMWDVENVIRIKVSNSLSKNIFLQIYNLASLIRFK